VLVEHLLAALVDQLPIEVQRIELGAIAPELGPATRRAQLPAALEAQLQAIEQADLLIVASPVYRGSYTGLFKHLFDFVHHDALIDVPVLLAATGGSERHALVIDHQLRPCSASSRPAPCPSACMPPRPTSRLRVRSPALRPASRWPWRALPPCVQPLRRRPAGRRAPSRPEPLSAFPNLFHLKESRHESSTSQPSSSPTGCPTSAAAWWSARSSSAPAGTSTTTALAQIAEKAGFEYALSQIRFTAGYGAEYQHESVAFSHALLATTGSR
jgi:MsuE subfamily FMN reductase